MLWLPGDGTVLFDEPRQLLAEANVVPPLAALARTLGWDSVPLSVREARRRAQASGLTARLEEALSAVEENAGRSQPTPGTQVSTRAASGAAQPTSVEENTKCSSRNQPALTLTKLGVRYGHVLAVNDISLQLEHGQVAALMGRNGSGKSSLLWAIQGATPSTGELDCDGADPRQVDEARARQLVSLVPQTPGDLLYLPTVGAECAQADKESGVPAGTTRALMERIGLELPTDRDPRDLSEGQRLALVLAIQLAATPKVVLLDEPTRGLDYAMKDHLCHILRDIVADGTSALVSTHDVEFAAQASSRVIVLADGDIVADGPTAEVLTSSAANSPQVAKVFWPARVLTVADVAHALGQHGATALSLAEV
jgi:energy-coupling factor transport system ATP-binding protein